MSRLAARYSNARFPSSIEEGKRAHKEKKRSHIFARRRGGAGQELDLPGQHHPVRSSKVASRCFLEVASTPPQPRRGVLGAPPKVLARLYKDAARLKGDSSAGDKPGLRPDVSVLISALVEDVLDFAIDLNGTVFTEMQIVA